MQILHLGSPGLKWTLRLVPVALSQSGGPGEGAEGVVRARRGRPSRGSAPERTRQGPHIALNLALGAAGRVEPASDQTPRPTV
jgi:hypothetical protein